ncbi:MAG: magnesium/cobalt transporter CorA [Chloroflexi bacterium]|nr:magnesium/cobalt transporter CorA [Chloroflexota bacterium]
MLTTLWYRGGSLRADVAPEQLASLLADPSALVWVDLQDPDAAELGLLERVFGFHPLAIEDVAKRRQRPKIDHYDDYEFVVLYDARLAARNHEVKLTQVGIFMGPNYVATTHHGTVEPLADFRQRWQQHPSLVEPHPLGFLLYHLTDGLVDSYFPVADRLEARIDDLESELFNGLTPHTLQKLLRLRAELITLRRIVGAERDVFNALSRRDQPAFHESTVVFFNDVYDHLLRLTDTLDIYRELLTGDLDAYLSQQSNKLNQVVKRLTAITLVLMVVTLVTGFCGMNVSFPGRDDPLGALASLATMALLGLGSWLVARRQDWL